MSWPLPDSWRATALARIGKQARVGLKRRKQANQERRTPKPVRSRDPLPEFEKNLFRKTFHQVLAHHYVLDLCAKTPHPGADPPRGYEVSEFIQSLGVSRSQNGRWHSEETFAAADLFFAFQTLIARTPIASLPSSGNSVILERSVYSMMKVLARKYDRPVSYKPGRQDLLLLVKLMSCMKQDSEALFNPHIKARGRANEAGLTRLVRAFFDETASRRAGYWQTRGKELETTFRDLLTRWGLAYSLFALGYRKNWPAVEVGS